MRVNPIGISSHLDGLSNTDLDTQLTFMQQAGIKWTRFDFVYSVVNPFQGVWDFSKYDNIVTKAAVKGISIIALVEHYGLPNYLLNGRVWLDPMQPSEYATFTQAVATHFQGQIPLYEMGNEPNGTVGSGSKGMTSASYSALIQSGYLAIKAGDPSAKVISAGLAQGGGVWQDPVTYLQQMYSNGAKGYFDYFGMHPYTQPNPPNFSVLDRLRSEMANNGDNKQIMITEVGWPTYSGSSGVTEANQASYISQVYQMIMHGNYDYVPIACIYDFLDDGTDPNNPEYHFGLLRTDYSQKPAYSAMQASRNDYNASFTPINP